MAANAIDLKMEVNPTPRQVFTDYPQTIVVLILLPFVFFCEELDDHLSSKAVREAVYMRGRHVLLICSGVLVAADMMGIFLWLKASWWVGAIFLGPHVLCIVFMMSALALMNVRAHGMLKG